MKGKKKMSEFKLRTITDNSQIVTYLPPELRQGKECYIDYYIKKPGTQALTRKRIKLNRAKKKLNKSDFRLYARTIIRNLNEKLAAGWNPFIEQEAPQGYTTLTKALEIFLNTKQRELKKNSMRSFNSFANTLNKYCSEVLKNPDIFVINFTSIMSKDFLKYKWLNSKISGKTYNNYIVGYHAIWSFFVEFNYSNVNVFDGITRKKNETKQRIEIPAETRMQIKKHLIGLNETAYWLMCELCFYCLIRPGEICDIKTINVHPEKQIIILNSGETKNNQERISSVPRHLALLLIEQLKKNSGNYLFSDTKGLVPGNKRLDPRKISRRWVYLREELKIKRNIEFYSLRDSGIIFLLGAVKNAEYVRDQADHYSLEMTTKYSKHFRPTGIQEIMDIDIQE